MYREFFSNMASIELPLAAMGFFLVAFAAILVHTLLRRRHVDDRISSLPLNDHETSDTSEVQP